MPNNNDNNDLFKTALIATPVAVGGIATYRRLGKAYTQFSEPIVPAFAANTAVREFANRYYVNPALQGPFKHLHARELRSLASGTSLTAEQVRESLLRSSRLADPTGNLTKYFDERLAFATTGEEALNDIALALEGTSSTYSRRATSIFLEDIGVIEERLTKGLSVSPVALESKIRTRVKELAPKKLDKIMQADLARIQELTGAQVSIKQVSRSDIPGAELHFEFSRMKDVPGKFTLRIPRPLEDQPGIIIRGGTQQSRYIAGTYGIIEEGILKQSFNHEQWTLRRATEDLIPQIMTEKRLSQRAIKRMVSDFESRIMEAPEWIPSIKPGIHKGVEEYERMRSQIMRLYTLTGGRLNEFEYSNLMARGGATLPEGGILPLFPGSSPSQIAKGVVSTADIRGGLALIPETASYGKRPLKFLRANFTPTQGALEAMAESALNEEFKWAAAKFGVETPITRAAYVSSTLDPALVGTGVTSEGQLLVSNRLASQRAVRQWQQFNVASNQMVDLANLIDKETGSSWSINKQLAKGTFLGYSPEGKPVVLPEDMFVTQATAFSEDKAKGDFIRVMAMKDIENMRYSKVFGGAKGMAVSVSPEYLEQVLTERVGVAQTKGDIYRGIDAIITMDELKKNRDLHYNQMFTSLWDFTKQNMKAGLTQASTFSKDPTNTIANIQKAALKEGHFRHKIALEKIVGLAREAKLTPEQMGRVFGAVPEVFGGFEALGAISTTEATEISRGIATGATQLFFEGLGGPGAGRTATIEPRMFEFLSAPHFGAVGKELQTEISERMITAYPHLLAEQREVTEALKSVASLKRREGAITAGGVLAGLGDELLPQDPTNLRITGLGDIYIPGAAQVSKLAEYRTATGAAVSLPLTHAYRDVLETAKRYEAKEVTKDAMRQQLSDLQKELINVRMGTVTGTGGLLRSRLPGSVFLTAVQPTLREKLAPGVVGITAPYAKQVFREMGRLGLYTDTELDILQKRFMTGGEIAGAIGRHPYIGPYSTQPAKFQLVAGKEPVAMINERMQRAVAYSGKLEGEALESFAVGARNALKGNKYMERRLNQIGGEILSSPIRLSPLVGLAGDVDGDIVSAMFVGPQLQKSLTSHIADKNALSAYEEHSIRSQVLKAKTAGDEVTLRKAMAGDVVKLGITEGGRLGRLSVGLQQYRAAVLSGMGGISTQERMQALSLLEWMEQTPISGKHIAPGKEIEMVHLLDDIQGALDRKSANGIADATRTILTNAKVSGQKALREGFTIAMEDIGTGEATTRFIPGIDINKSADNIVKASKAYEAASVGQLSASKLRRLIMGRGNISKGVDVNQLLKEDVLKMSPFGGFFAETATKTSFSEFATRATTLMNKIGASGRSMLTHARPLAFGGAAALGVAALLSEPPKFLPPGSNIAPSGILKSGTGGADLDTDIHPESHVAGAPTVRNPVEKPGSAMVAQKESQGYRVNIKGNTAQNINYRNLTNQLRQSTGGRTQINSNVRDQRSSLTAHKLSSILQDE